MVVGLDFFLLFLWEVGGKGAVRQRAVGGLRLLAVFHVYVWCAEFWVELFEYEGKNIWYCIIYTMLFARD